MIQRQFTRAILLALILPIILLCRSTYESYVKSIESIKRSHFSNQNDFALELEDMYLKYIDGLENLARKFSKDKVFQRLPGWSDPDLWCNLKRKFQTHLDKNPEMKKKLVLAYSRQKLAFRKKILKVLFPGKNLVPMHEVPIWLQVYVFEPSLYHPNYSGGAFCKHNGLEPVRPIRLSEIVKRTGRDIPKSEKERNRLLSKTGLFPYFNEMPRHPVIPIEDEMVTYVQGELVDKLQSVMRVVTFGSVIANPEKVLFEKGVNASFENQRGKFYRGQLGTRSFTMMWEIIPRSYKLENYDKGFFEEKSVEAPRAIFQAVMLPHVSRSFFLSQIMQGKHIPIFKTLLEDAKVYKNTLRSSTINALLLRMHLQDQNTLKPQKKSEIMYQSGLEANQHTLSNQEELDGIEISRILGFENPDTGSYEVTAQELISWASNRAPEFQTEGRMDFPTLVRLARHLERVLHFEFVWKGSRYLGTLHPSPLIPEGELFFFEPLEELKRPVMIQLLLQLGFLLLSLVLSYYLVRRLRKKVVHPILALEHRVRLFGEGNYESRVEPYGENEIATLQTSFNAMARSIEEKHRQVEISYRLGILLEQGADQQTLIQAGVEELLKFSGGELVALGIGRGRLNFDLEDFHWCQSSYQTQEFKESVLIETKDEFSMSATHMKIQGSLMNIRGKNYFLGRTSDLFEKEQKWVSRLIILSPGIHVSMRALVEIMELILNFTNNMRLRQLELETLRGEQVQKALLPGQREVEDFPLELVSLFQSCQGLAGDFYDLYTYKDIHYMVVADVSGKGIGPALFGIRARSFLKTSIEKNSDPGELLGNLNEFMCLCSDERSSLFLTLFLIRIDPEKHELSYASAGHNQMIFQGITGEVTLLNGRGIPIGLFESARYETVRINYTSGCELVLYTDGLTELEDSNQALFGLDRVLEFSRAHQGITSSRWKESLESVLSDFRKGIHLSDDLTILRARL